MHQLVYCCLLISGTILANVELTQDVYYEMNAANDKTVLIRAERDGYGGGCSCPYNSCGQKQEKIVAFGIGTLVGLLLALLQAIYNIPPTPAAPGMPARSFSKVFNIFDYFSSLESVRDDIMPLLSDLAMVYNKSDHYSDCTRQWFCEIVRRAAAKEGIGDMIATLASVVYEWYSDDEVPIIVNILHNPKDCEKLGPDCGTSFFST